MPTAITKIRPEEKRIYDFRPDYVKKQISMIKQTYSKRCLEDNRLSDEYKTYVKNVDNIFVKFTPVYGFDCKLSLGSVHADVSFFYTLSYVSGTTVSGTASVSSSGDVKLSNVHTTDHYSSSREQKTTNGWWHSSATESCVMHVGAAAYSDYDLKNYNEVTDQKQIPTELEKIASISITYELLNSYVKPSSLPSHVYDALIDNAINFYKNDSPKNMRMDRITDYSVDQLWIAYLPYTYEFDVWCNFEGETYKQHCKTISDIESIGQLSRHYEKYQVLVAEQCRDFQQKLKGVRSIYTISIFISIIGALGLISLLAFGKLLRVEGLRHYYLPTMIAVCVGALAIIAVSIVAAKRKRYFHVTNRDYDSDRSHAELAHHLQQKATMEHKKIVKHAVLFLSVVVLLLCGLGTGAFFMCKDVYAEHFLYTPEIIGSYYSYEDGAFNKLTILSCDGEGKVEAIFESSYKQSYAKSKETGEILRKNGDGLQIKFSLAEALYTPQKGRFEETSYATFSADYCQITDYSDATMIREDIWLEQGHSFGNIQDAQLGAYYIYSKNIANVLEINSLNENNGVSFTLITVSKAGYSVKKGEGKVLFVNPDGSCFVDFQMPDITQVGCISADGQTIMADVEYSKSKGNVIFVDSTSDFLNINDAAANPRLFVLTKDLDFEGRSVSFVSSLCGTVLGNGHTIKNFVLSSGFNSSAGLFGTIYEDAVICDLKIENGRLETEKDLKYAGLLCGYLNGTVIRVTASGTVNAPNASNIGGLVGKSTSTGKVIDCNHTVSVNQG